MIGRLAELGPERRRARGRPGPRRPHRATSPIASRHVHAVELDRSLEPRARESARRPRRTSSSTSATRSSSTSPRSNRRRRSSSRTCRTTSPRRSSSRAWTACRASSSGRVMVQREVADRFFAQPSTKAYGAVSVLVQLAAERTGFHPVSRTVFRPRPNVDSALVAFRRASAARVVSPREAGRRRRVRAPAQDAAELARARRRRQRASRPPPPSRRSAASRACAPRSSRRPSSSRSPKRSADETRTSDREAQPRARRRPAARRRPPRGRDGAPARRPRRPDLGRAGAGASGRGFPEDTLVRGALESLAAAAGAEPRWQARIWKHIPVAAGLGGGSSDAATALRLANETLPDAALAARPWPSSPRPSAPTCPSSSPPGRSSPREPAPT